MNNNYAGDISPCKTWEMLMEDRCSFLIDVRTEKEWHEDGIPDLSKMGKDVILSPWLGTEQRALFVNDIRLHLQKVAPSATSCHLFFICRSGKRSKEAAIAASAAGYAKSFNVSSGFCGAHGCHPYDTEHQINNNWKSEKLPWGYINHAKI